MKSRIRKALQKCGEQDLDGLLVSLPSNISYLTHYPSRDSYLLISPHANTYFTDSRYTEEAKSRLKGTAIIRKANGSVFKSIAEVCREQGMKRVGFEERYLANAEYLKIQSYLKKNGRLVGTHSIIENLRQINHFVESHACAPLQHSNIR